MSLKPEQADGVLRMMLTIRRFEEKMLDFLNTGVIKGGSHLYIGQEAVATGVCTALGRMTSSRARTVGTVTAWPRAAIRRRSWRRSLVARRVYAVAEEVACIWRT